MLKDYSSCPHLLPDVIAGAILVTKSISKLDTCKANTYFVCCQCSYSGRLSDLKSHSLTHSHFVCIRKRDLTELYCLVCQDFQFSSAFDLSNSRKRSTPPPASKSCYSNLFCRDTKRIKGFCNMGSTCFMSSILQVLMKNEVFMDSLLCKNSLNQCKSRPDKSISADNSSRQSSDSGNNAATRIAPICIFCEFKHVYIEAR